MRVRVIVATCLVVCLCGCLKPQHEAIGPGDVGDDAAQPGVYKAAIVAKLSHKKPKEGKITPSSAVRDAGPYALGIASLLFGAGNPMFVVLGVCGADVAKTALAAADNQEIHQDTLTVDIPPGYSLTWIRKPDGTSLMQLLPADGEAAPAAPVNVDPIVEDFRKSFSGADVTPQPEGIAPK